VVKLQKHKAYTYTTESGEDIEHYKHTVTIPDDVVRELGWQTGVELRPEVKDSALVLRAVFDDKVTDTEEPRLLDTLRRITEEKQKARQRAGGR